MTDYQVYEFSRDVTITYNDGRSGEISIDSEGAIEAETYGGTWVGDLRTGAQLSLEDAIELSVLLTTQIIPFLMEKENES